jgi:hypothetical protein
LVGGFAWCYFLRQVRAIFVAKTFAGDNKALAAREWSTWKLNKRLKEIFNEQLFFGASQIHISIWNKLLIFMSLFSFPRFVLE